MFRINERQIFYLLLIAGAGFFLHMARAIPSGIGVPGDPGAGFLPFWVSALIMLLVGYLLVAETLWEKSESPRFSRHEAVVLGVTLAAIVVYLLLLSVAGFLVSTLLFLCAFRQFSHCMMRGEGVSLRSLAASTLFAVLVTGFVYLVFAVLFKLALP